MVIAPIHASRVMSCCSTRSLVDAQQRGPLKLYVGSVEPSCGQREYFAMCMAGTSTLYPRSELACPRGVQESPEGEGYKVTIGRLFHWATETP